jgi:hypothetical protein
VAFTSIFATNHSDFLLIWTDLVPLAVYVALFVAHVSSARYAHAPTALQLVEAGVFAGPLICRSASSFYHVFNCASAWTRQRLIQVDLIGISFMVLPCPYFYLMATHAGVVDGGSSLVALGASHVVVTDAFVWYVGALVAMQAVCVALFGRNLWCGETPWGERIRQPALLVVAAAGNAAALGVAMAPGVAWGVRVRCAVAVVLPVLAYVVCFSRHYPERLYEEGSADGQWWNSHVIWHVLLFVSQLCLMSVPWCAGAGPVLV